MTLVKIAISSVVFSDLEESNIINENDSLDQSNEFDDNDSLDQSKEFDGHDDLNESKETTESNKYFENSLGSFDKYNVWKVGQF